MLINCQRRYFATKAKKPTKFYLNKKPKFKPFNKFNNKNKFNKFGKNKKFKPFNKFNKKFQNNKKFNARKDNLFFQPQVFNPQFFQNLYEEKQKLYKLKKTRKFFAKHPYLFNRKIRRGRFVKFIDNYFTKKFRNKQRNIDQRYFIKLKKIERNPKFTPYASTIEFSSTSPYFQPFNYNFFRSSKIFSFNKSWEFTPFLNRLKKLKSIFVPILQQKLYRTSFNILYRTQLNYITRKKKIYYRASYPQEFRSLPYSFINPTAYSINKIPFRKSLPYFIIFSKFVPNPSYNGRMSKVSIKNNVYYRYGLKRLVQKYESTKLLEKKRAMFSDELENLFTLKDFKFALNRWRSQVITFKSWLKTFLIDNDHLLNRRFFKKTKVPTSLIPPPIRRFKKKRFVKPLRLLQKPVLFKSYNLELADKKFHIAEFLGVRKLYNSIQGVSKNYGPKYSPSQLIRYAVQFGIKDDIYSDQNFYAKVFTNSEVYKMFDAVMSKRLDRGLRKLGNKNFVTNPVKLKFGLKRLFLLQKRPKRLRIYRAKLLNNSYYLLSLSLFLERKFLLSLFTSINRLAFNVKSPQLYDLDKLLSIKYSNKRLTNSCVEPESFPFLSFNRSSYYSASYFKAYLKSYFLARLKLPYRSWLSLTYFSSFDTKLSSSKLYSQFNSLNGYGHLAFSNLLPKSFENSMMTSFFINPQFRSHFLIRMSFRHNNLFMTAYTNPRTPLPSNLTKPLKRVHEHLYNKFIKGAAVTSVSTGMAGFKGPKRTTTVAAYEAGKLLATKLVSKKIRQSVIVVRKFNDRILGSALRGLADRRVGFKVLALDYQYRVSHSDGLRARKFRRV